MIILATITCACSFRNVYDWSAFNFLPRPLKQAVKCNEVQLATHHLASSFECLAGQLLLASYTGHLCAANERRADTLSYLLGCVCHAVVEVID